MTNPTSNFGWQMPTASDLVTDLPADFETFGQAVDTSLADLKGGTTGQVLSKTTDADMDFTWVAADDTNAIQNAIVDAKGDLIAASAADTPARLAVGNNGETLVADSSTSTGLRYTSNFAAGKNKIINGDFGVWQRGTTLNLPGGVGSFLADRFNIRVDGAAGTPVYSRQTFTPGTAPVAGYEGQYFARFTTGGNVTCSVFNQPIEDVRTFAGQTITVSFWMKTSTAKTFSMLLRQDFGSGGSANVDQFFSYTTTTSWQRFTQTLTLGSMSGKTIGTNSQLLLQTVTYAAQTGNFDIDVWGVQIEAGSVATAFQTATGTIQGELAACQRYFQKTNNQSEVPGTAPSTTPINAINASTVLVVGVPPFKGVMRKAPTITFYSSATGTSGKIRSGGADRDATAADVGEFAIGYISSSSLVAGSNSTITYTASAEL